MRAKGPQTGTPCSAPVCWAHCVNYRCHRQAPGWLFAHPRTGEPLSGDYMQRIHQRARHKAGILKMGSTDNKAARHQRRGREFRGCAHAKRTSTIRPQRTWPDHGSGVDARTCGQAMAKAGVPAKHAPMAAPRSAARPSAFSTKWGPKNSKTGLSSQGMGIMKPMAGV